MEKEVPGGGLKYAFSFAVDLYIIYRLTFEEDGTRTIPTFRSPSCPFGDSNLIPSCSER